MSATLTVVGIGADGLAGVGEAARAALAAAPLLVGSARQLDLLPAEATAPGARRLPWPSPLDPLADALARGEHGDACVLASGDPMLHGIGATLLRRGAVPEAAAGAAGDPAGASEPAGATGPAGRGGPAAAAAHPAPGRGATLRVIPHPSAFALACARLGWPAAETDLLSAVARDPSLVAAALQPGRRLVAYVTGADGAARLADVLVARGFGPSRFVVLEQLGSPERERLRETTAEAWGERPADPLHAVAIEPRPAPGTRPLPPTAPGLPDDAYDSDGQLTKRHVRAVTLAALAPLPGELLWDVGAGSGSIAIEWLRGAPRTRAVAIEADPERAARVARNAATLGVADRLTLVEGRAPAALPGAAAPAPDAIFVGGGLTAPGLLERCWEALRPGGRLVANAVTLESERLLHEAHAARGGALTRIEIAHAQPIGGFTGWRAQMPVVQWEARKEEEPRTP